MDLLLQNIDAPLVDGMNMPGLPITGTFAGASALSKADALRQASAFYRVVKAYSDALAMPLGLHRRVLDFGVGWGCFPMFFMRDVDAANIHGCDFDTALLDLGRENHGAASFDRLYPKGKLPYPDNYFDCMIARSAFTHMPQPEHVHWMRELARVAAPGCVFTLAVQPRRFLEPAAGAAPDAVERSTALLKMFDRGEIAYVPPAEDAKVEASLQGSAAVPIEFIRSHWKPPFEVRDVINEEHRFAEAVVILQHA